jgi:hypothetical protein
MSERSSVGAHWPLGLKKGPTECDLLQDKIARLRKFIPYFLVKLEALAQESFSLAVKEVENFIFFKPKEEKEIALEELTQEAKKYPHLLKIIEHYKRS